MKRTRTHEIDEEAMRILQAYLPSGWVRNDQHPDYGKDFLVEIVEDEELTGFNFFIQLKGQESLLVVDQSRFVSFPLKKKHAIYYADKVKQPVFLVVVDVHKRLGYWVFLQKHLLEDRPSQQWRLTKSVNLHLPVNNALSDIEGLRRAVLDAHDYMAARHPSAITFAIKAEKDRLERLDPRIAIAIEATEQGRHIHVMPREPIDVSLTFKGETALLKSKLDELFGRGKPVAFQPEELQVTGSALFEEVFRRGGTLVPPQDIPATVSFGLRNELGHTVGRLAITGHMSGGPEECRFAGTLGRSPVNISMTCVRQTMHGDLRFGFDTKRWHGQPISLLAHFAEIEAFFASVKSATTVDLIWAIEGNQLIRAAVQLDSFGFLRRLADFLPILTQARDIGRHFKIDPALPSNFASSHGREINNLDRLLKNREYRQRVPGARITVRAESDGVAKLLENPPDAGFPVRITPEEDHREPFLETQVIVGKVEYVYTETRLSSRISTLKNTLAKDPARTCKLEFTCSPSCELVVKRIAPELREPDLKMATPGDGLEPIYSKEQGSDSC